MTRYKENLIHERLKIFKYIGILFFLGLAGRLYYLQIYDNEDLRLASLRQRSTEVSLNANRGTIYDRNLTSLTNEEKIKTLIVPRDLVFNDINMFNQIKSHTILNNKELNELVNGQDRLLKIPMDDEIDINPNIKNVFLTDIVNRYSNNNLLSHVIGYVNKSENKGETGIEKVHDEFLKKSSKESLFIEYDKSRSLILGSSYYVDSNTIAEDPNGVQLTIDKNIQSLVEEVLDSERIKGGVVVADIETGEILASASRPNFNQNNIEDYLYRDDMALYNKAIQVSYPPGSIFKIVVLLAALEDDIDYTNHKFYCKGYEEINNLKIKCNNIKGHGKISLKDGFSKSCNSVFIQIGKELGAEKITSMARKLGFGEKVSIGLIEEIEGNLPTGNQLLGPAIGNISIGQGEIEATPLQVTNMLLTILNNGIKKDMTIIKGITTKDGIMIKPYNKLEDQKIVGAESSQIVKELLEEVVAKGTAKSMDLEEIGGGGGKTGSAEAFFKGNPTIHGWFTGFYPKKNPKYGITILVEEANSGSKSAAPIFEKICKEIYKLNP